MQQFCDDFLCRGRAGAGGEQRWDAQHSQPCSPCCPQNLPLGSQDPTVSHSHQGYSTATQPRTAATPTQTLLTHSTSSQPADALSNYRTFFQLQQKRDGQNRLFIWTEIRISPGVLHSAACSIQLYNIPHSEKPPSNAGVLSFSQLLPAASQSHSHFTA